MYLDVLRKSIEDLFGHIDGLGEITLTLLVNHILPRIVPVEIAN